MGKNAAHTKWWQIFEVVFGVPFLLALLLHWLWPLSLYREAYFWFFATVGLLLILAGVILVVLARREFANYGQPTDPGFPTQRIVTTGVFSLSRNPLYLGGVSFLLGIALAADLLWVVILLFPAIIVCHFVLIVPEERYLVAKFGSEYEQYASSVNRWIGRRKPSENK